MSSELRPVFFRPDRYLPHPRPTVTFFRFAIAFGLLVVVAVGYGYGTRFQWLQAVQTAAGAGVDTRPIAGVVFENVGKLLVCALSLLGLCLVPVAGATDHTVDSDFLHHGHWCIVPLTRF